MPAFNCIFCGQPLQAEEADVRCLRCNETQRVPEVPPFFHDFTEAQLQTISERTRQARNRDIALDPAIKSALDDDGRDALEEMHMFDTHHLHDLRQDLPLILLHGYRVGRVSLGVPGRSLHSRVPDAAKSELPWRLRQKANELLHSGMFGKLDPITQYCLWQAFNEWFNFEFHTRGLKEEMAVLTSRVQEWVKLGYALAIAEERIWADVSETPEPTTRVLVKRLIARPDDRIIESDVIEMERDGQEHWSGYRFFDALGKEIPKDPHLEQGPVVTEPSGLLVRRHRLNVTRFLSEHFDLIATVHHVTDGRRGTRVVYSDLESGARPLREFFALIGAEV